MAAAAPIAHLENLQKYKDTYENNYISFLEKVVQLTKNVNYLTNYKNHISTKIRILDIYKLYLISLEHPKIHYSR